MARTKTTRRDSYLELVQEFPLVSIQSAEQLAAASGFLDSVMSRSKLEAGQHAYVGALSDLIELYEDEHVRLPRLSGRSLLAFLMEQHGLKQSDVSRKTGIQKSLMSEMLNGKRSFSKAAALKLAELFHVDASVFLRS